MDVLSIKLVIPVYIRTIKKDYVWSEPDLVYFDDSEKTCIHLNILLI